MANLDKDYFRTQDSNRAFWPILAVATIIIAIGDLLFMSARKVDKAANIGDIPGTHATLAAAQEAFHDAFVGVADAAGDDDTEVKVQTRGPRVMACVSATYEPGDLVGPNDNGGGTALVNELIGVATPNLAIGRVIIGGTNVTSITVEIESTLFHGGPRAIA